MPAEENGHHDYSSFWLGLLIGAVATGVVVYLLDKEGKGNLVENLKKDIQLLLAKVNQLVTKDSQTEVKVVDSEVSQDSQEMTAVRMVKPSLKFFKKNGKRLN